MITNRKPKRNCNIMLLVPHTTKSNLTCDNSRRLGQRCALESEMKMNASYLLKQLRFHVANGCLT